MFAVSNLTSYSLGSDSKSTQSQNAIAASSSTTTTLTTPPTRREFTLVAEEANLQIAPGEVVKAWTYNGTVSGPTLRLTEGDNVTIHFINKTPLVHTLHMHGNHDDKTDGVNPQILPGQNYTYNFIANPAGAFTYHCHAYPYRFTLEWGCMVR